MELHKLFLSKVGLNNSSIAMNVSASRSVEASLLTKWSVETKFVAICVDLKIKCIAAV